VRLLSGLAADATELTASGVLHIVDPAKLNQI